MGKISEEVITTIEKENIRPIGRWSFILKDSILWAIFVLNILIGSLGLNISLYLFKSTEILEIYSIAKDPLQVILLSIPIVWLIFTIAFVVIAYINFRYTKRGYKLSFIKIVLINIASIAILGSLLNFTDLSYRINKILKESIPYYTKTVDPRYVVWNRPQQGYLAGKIIDIKDGLIKLESLEEQNIWTVDISNANVRMAVNLNKGEMVKILGTSLESNSFKASEVLPWEGRGRKLQENLK